MTAATVALPRVAPTGGLTFGRVLNAEWIKFRSVRATLWTLPLTAVAMIGFAVLQAWGLSTLDTTEDFIASAIVTGGSLFGQVVVSVLAVLTITGEYSTGQIRSTFSAVPRRLPVLWCKALILAASVAVVAVISVALSWLGALPFLNSMGLTMDLGNADTVRALVGAPLYLAATALFALAVGTLLRHSAGALSLVLGLLLALENLFAALPFAFFEKVSPFLPSTAGSRILSEDAAIDSMNMVTNGVHLSAWQGYGVLLAWVAVLLTAAAVLLRRRDA